MTATRRRKRTRARGSWTQGWGKKNRHKGSGNKGGVGMAGTGKRSHNKKTKILKEFGWDYFGKIGFKIPQKVKTSVVAVNLQDILKKLDKLLAQGLAKKEKDIIVIDLKSLGYDKLLGTGKVNQKLKIIVPFASKNVVEKIKEAGGEVTSTLELKP